MCIFIFQIDFFVKFHMVICLNRHIFCIKVAFKNLINNDFYHNWIKNWSFFSTIL